MFPLLHDPQIMLFGSLLSAARKQTKAKSNKQIPFALIPSWQPEQITMNALIFTSSPLGKVWDPAATLDSGCLSQTIFLLCLF